MAQKGRGNLLSPKQLQNIAIQMIYLACLFSFLMKAWRETDRNLIATLAYQLSVMMPRLKLFIAKAIEDDLSKFQKDVDTQMERLIINPIIQATEEGKILRYPILIIIDGLDECKGVKEQCAFLQAISGAIGRYSLPLYFFITSCQEGHIVNWLNKDRTPHQILNLDQHHIEMKKRHRGIYLLQIQKNMKHPSYS